MITAFTELKKTIIDAELIITSQIPIPFKQKVEGITYIEQELSRQQLIELISKCHVSLLPSKYDFVVSRAVTAFPDFMNIVRDLFRKNPKIKEKGIIYLKGGDFNAEIAGMQKVRLYDVSDIFEEEFFETKRIIFLPKK